MSPCIVGGPGALNRNPSSRVTRPVPRRAAPSANRRQARSRSAARKSTACRVRGRSRARSTSSSTPEASCAAALLGEEVDGDRLHCAVVDAELAVRVAAGCEEEQGAAPRLVQLAFGDLDAASRDVGGDRERVAELAGLDPLQEGGERVLAHGSPRSAGPADDGVHRHDHEQAEECAPDHVARSVRRDEHERRGDRGRPDPHPRRGPAPEERQRVGDDDAAHHVPARERVVEGDDMDAVRPSVP